MKCEGTEKVTYGKNVKVIEQKLRSKWKGICGRNWKSN